MNSARLRGGGGEWVAKHPHQRQRLRAGSGASCATITKHSEEKARWRPVPRTAFVIVDPKARTAVEDRHKMVQACKSVRILCRQAHLEKQLTTSEVISLRRTVSGGLHKWRSSNITIARMCCIPMILEKLG